MESPDAPARLAMFEQLLGVELVGKLRHLELVRKQLHEFNNDPRNARMVGRALRQQQNPFGTMAADLAARSQRDAVEGACLSAERAVAVLLFEVHQRFEREARTSR